MTTFLALYRGETVSSAKLVAVTVNQALVREVASKLLDDMPENTDAVLQEVEQGRRSALRLIQGGNHDT